MADYCAMTLRLNPDHMLDSLEPGQTVFLHAGPCEPRAFADALAKDPERAAGVTLVGVFIPGINSTDYCAIAPQLRLRTTFVTPAFAESFAAGKIDLMPKSYFGFARHLATHPVDVAFLRVSPPGPDGRMGFGINQDYAPIVAHNAKRVIALVDSAMPHVHGEPGLRAEDCYAIIDMHEAMRSFPAAPAGQTLAQVGANAATLIEDGDTIQIGIGKVQSAVLSNLFDRKNLGLHSGMIDDSIAALFDAGVMNNSKKSQDKGIGITGIAIGSEAAIACAQRSDVAFRAANYTHSATALAAQDNLVAINSAIDVDLLGQCNAETINGRQISGAGGFHDFMRGAGEANNGRSIVALPSTVGSTSRIVPMLSAPGIATGPRNDADIIVTEHGIARLRDLPLDARAEALIAIAAPEHRSSLTNAWRDLRARI